jgi:hypothetical protein
MNEVKLKELNIIFLILIPLTNNSKIIINVFILFNFNIKNKNNKNL